MILYELSTRIHVFTKTLNLLWSGSISIYSKLMEICVKWIVLISLVLFNVYSWLIVDNGWIKCGKPYGWSIDDCLDFGDFGYGFGLW